MVHLDFVCELYRYQLEQGRYFLHEHPDGASSWNTGGIKRLMEEPRVVRVVCDQCQYGQMGDEGNPMRKRIGWMTNSDGLAGELTKRCDGVDGECSRRLGGRHRRVSGSIAKQAAYYPPQLCKAILRG